MDDYQHNQIVMDCACSVDFKAQEDASSAIVQHAWNVFRPPAQKSAAFTVFRILIFAFPALS